MPAKTAAPASPRRSFVVALKDIPEVWEVSYDPKAPEIPIGVITAFVGAPFFVAVLRRSGRAT